jgi:hypothetical protein
LFLLLLLLLLTCSPQLFKAPRTALSQDAPTATAAAAAAAGAAAAAASMLPPPVPELPAGQMGDMQRHQQQGWAAAVSGGMQVRGLLISSA